jgi:Peptidase S24-like
MESDVQFLVLQKQNLVAEVLRTSGKVTLAARGHSMLPTLWPGDLLTVETTTFEQVCPGDIVLYQRSERFFIHRVLRKLFATGSDRPSLVTRGDSMSGLDSPVLPEELLGKVVSVERASKLRVPMPVCSKPRRILGLALGASDRLRSAALRWHGWRTGTKADSLASANHARTGPNLS